jgi:hypothetical protein
MSGDMRFAGYAAVFDRVDRGGDVVRPGATNRAASPWRRRRSRRSAAARGWRAGSWGGSIG